MNERPMATTRRALVILLVLGGATALGGCKRRKPPSYDPLGARSVPTSVASTTAARPPKPVALPAAPAPDAPGPAYILYDKAIVAIDVEGAFTKVAGLENVRDLVRGSDGRFYAVEAKTIHVLDGLTATEVATHDGLDHIAVRADGHFVGSKVYDLYEGAPGASSKDDWKKIYEKPGFIPQVTYAGTDGALYVTALVASRESGNFRIDGGVATELSLPKAPAEVYERALGYASTKDGVYVVRAKDVLFVKPGTTTGERVFDGSKGLRNFRSITAHPDGSITVQGEGAEAWVVAPNAGKKPPAKLDFQRPSGEVMVADASLRFWYFSANELLLAPRKGPTQLLTQGTLPLLDHRITAAAVVGTGPTKVAPVPLRTGTVKGKVARGGGPLAKATVEMCRAPSTFIHNHPCEDATTRHEAVTNAAGEFEIADAPVGPQNFAIKDKKGWIVSIRYSGERIVDEGKALDIGTLDLDRANR